MSRKTLEDAVAVHKRFYSQSEWGSFMNGARVGYGQGKAEAHDENNALRAEVERLTAERDALVPVLEQIDLKAQAGLCYFTLESARAFLQDIRKIISAATQGSKP